MHICITRAFYYYCNQTFSQSFQPMVMQLTIKAVLPLAKSPVTVSCRSSNTGPWPAWVNPWSAKRSGIGHFDEWLMIYEMLLKIIVAQRNFDGNISSFKTALWPLMAGITTFVIGWSKDRLGLPSAPLHYGLTWPVGIPTFFRPLPLGLCKGTVKKSRT